MTGTSIVVTAPRGRTFHLFLAAILLLDIAFVATHLVKLQGGYEGQLGFRRLFNMDGEGTLPAWFSSALMLICAALLAVVAATKTRTGDRFRWHWWGLALAFLYLSADEASEIHEMLNRAAYALMGGVREGVYAPWIAFAIAALLAGALVYGKFLANLEPETRRRFLVAGACFVAGAVVAEWVGTAIAGVQGLNLQPEGWQDKGDFSIEYMLLIAIEETLEMLGLALFVCALLGYVTTGLGRVSFVLPGRAT